MMTLEQQCAVAERNFKQKNRKSRLKRISCVLEAAFNRGCNCDNMCMESRAKRHTHLPWDLGVTTNNVKVSLHTYIHCYL